MPLSGFISASPSIRLENRPIKALINFCCFFYLPDDVFFLLFYSAFRFSVLHQLSGMKNISQREKSFKFSEYGWRNHRHNLILKTRSESCENVPVKFWWFDGAKQRTNSILSFVLHLSHDSITNH